MNKENVFYIVVDKKFPTRVTYKHENFDSADKEAKRLANKCQGEEFVVMVAMKSYKVVNLIETEFVMPCDNPSDPGYIPF